MTDIAADYIVVDTLRVARDTFARIWEAWRDGYTDSIVEHSAVSREEIERALARDDRLRPRSPRLRVVAGPDVDRPQALTESSFRFRTWWGGR